MAKYWKQNLQSCRGKVIGKTCSLPYKRLENLEVPIKSLENEKKKITDWPRSLVWNQQLLAVYKFFQRNVWKSSLQHFYCVFLHQFCCQNDLMGAEYSLCLILSNFFDTSISKKRQLFSVRQLRLTLWSRIAATVMHYHTLHTIQMDFGRPQAKAVHPGTQESVYGIAIAIRNYCILVCSRD